MLFGRSEQCKKVLRKGEQYPPGYRVFPNYDVTTEKILNRKMASNLLHSYEFF